LNFDAALKHIRSRPNLVRNAVKEGRNWEDYHVELPF
jgi:hypothetical protein